MGRLLIMEFTDNENMIFDKIMATLTEYPEFQEYQLQNEAILSFPCLEIYLDRRKVYSGNREIVLTKKEFDILYLFAVNQGRVLTYEQIYQNVWNELPEGSIRKVILYHVINLRKKLSMVQGLSIKCIREIGYCLELSGTEEKSG